MAYDTILAARIRAALSPQEGLEEKKMFGGVSFLVNGNLACGVIKNDLIVRVGPEKHAKAMSQPHTRVFDFSGRPMAGWVTVAPEGCATAEALDGWVRQGMEFALTLPKKEK